MSLQPRHGGLLRRSSRLSLWGGVAVLWALAGADPVRAEDALARQLVGETLSAVVYASASPGAVSGKSLRRVVLQAYLEPDGRALSREWDSSRDRYSVPAPARWTLAADRLCIDLRTGALCANVHVWGPRIAGIGVQPYTMLDGDLRPGNTITGK